MLQVTVGCDPEVFVRKNGKFHSAHGLIPGDKKHPFQVKDGAVQVDGMALEFNIDPAATSGQFIHNIQSVFDQMCKMVPGYEVAVVPVAHFDAAHMKAQPREALELGCEPDFNGWTGDVNIKPNGERPMRTASGHVHIGWTNNQDIHDPSHVGNAHAVVRQMDFFLGLGSLFFDDDKLRREMYGKAGCCRIKSYGVEYRTLSNAWLKDTKLMKWVFDNVQSGMSALIGGDNMAERFGDIQGIINNSDKKKAKAILDKAGIPYFA